MKSQNVDKTDKLQGRFKVSNVRSPSTEVKIAPSQE